MSFTDTSTDSDGTIAARAWDLDDDGQFDDGTGASAQRTFAAAGTYTVRLQVTDDDGAPGDRDPPGGRRRPRRSTRRPARPSASAPAAPVAGQQVTFGDTSTDADGTIAARAWDLDNDGAFDDGTGTSAQTTFAAAGTYTVRLQVTDDDGAPAVASRPGGGGGRSSAAGANLLSNPSFETNLSGWSGYQATLLREAQAGAPQGGFVAKVTRSTRDLVHDRRRRPRPCRP